MMMTKQQTNPEVLRLIEAMERVADDLQALSDRIAEPTGELSDERIHGIFYPMGVATENQYMVARACARAVIAADRALQASHIAVPATDDWKLVPLEPTAEMLQAGQDTPVSESDEDSPEDYKAVYRSMLAAAPRHHQAARVPMTGQCFDGDWGADYHRPALQRAERQPMTMDQADDLLQNRKLHGGVLIDLVRDVEKHHGIGSESQQVAELEKDAEIAALKAERDALKQDAERLDWLDQNIFSRENINFMGQLDPTMNMWVTFSPKGHQGSARNILDAAMQAQGVKS